MKGKIGEKLDKEILRIKSHTSSQYSELDEDILKLQEQIRELNGEDEDKIINLRVNLRNLENSNEKEKAKKDEKFFINNEIRKHALEVRHVLSNVAVIYYPVFVYHVALKSKSSSRS